MYSAFSTKLQIGGDLIVRSDNDIRVTNINFKESTGGAYETYNNKYTKDTTSMFVTLPSNSSITYEVEITNDSSDDYSLTNIEALNNTNLNYTLSTKQYDVYKNNNERTIDIIITNEFSEEIVSSIILKFTFKKAVSTFVNGELFNKKIKLLAGTDLSGSDNSYDVSDSNITSIKRSYILPDNTTFNDNNILSTSVSTVPIYAWYDNNIIYYYTNVDKPFMNSNLAHMFRMLQKVESVDISTIDTSKVTTTSYMFYGCSKLAKIDLSNFDTSSVTSLASMFEGSGFKTLDLSSFNTRNVVNTKFMFSYSRKLESIIFGDKFTTKNVLDMQSMFRGLISLKSVDISMFDTSNVINFNSMFIENFSLSSLDLSNFDLSKAANTYNMLYSMSSLQELKTPKAYPTDTSLTISLPKTLYDENDNEYTVLDSTSPTETWLKIK